MLDAKYVGQWWHRDLSDDRIVCDLCPRQCRLKEGDRGFCFVRKVDGGDLVLDTYGKSTGFCVDPIEKKPLNHFYPGTSVLSFGTAGCNLGCQFCQNWDISKSREVAKLSAIAEPELIAEAAKQLQCRSVAYTYNDPIVWAEYAMDTAKVCRSVGIKNVAVTAGYIMPEARKAFFAEMDAANVDLKAFSEEFYRKITYSRLDTVLETLRYLRWETDVWFEITNLVIPDSNDSADELTRMCDWIVASLGPEVPVHFSAFHPDFRMTDKPRTPHSKLIEAYEIAKRSGVLYPYIGNVHDVERSSTYCKVCQHLLIERDWYQLGKYELNGNTCRQCGTIQSGKFDEHPGDWGRKRLPVNLATFRSVPAPASNNGVSLPVLHSSTPRPSNVSEESMAEPFLSAPVKLEMLKIDELTAESKLAIHRAAQRVIIARVYGRNLTLAWTEGIDAFTNQHVMGLFTTLSRGVQLRGCCGFVGKPTQLAEAIYTSSIRTAKEDTRMPAISPSELPYLNLDVTLLSAPILLTCPASERANHVEVGKHGLRISVGQQGGLLLPSVPVEQGWNVEQFLQGVCRKAGLPENAWLDEGTRLETFEGLQIEGVIEEESLPSERPVVVAPGSIESLQVLKAAATQNMIAFSHGAVPNYYVLDAMDGNVNGVVLTLVNNTEGRPLAHWIKTSMRPGMPLQANLFELCKSAEEVLRKARFDKPTDVDLAVTVLFDPAQQGVIEFDDWTEDKLNSELPKCDMRGVHSSQRAVVAICGDRVAVAFDAEKSADQLLQEAASSVRTRRYPIGIYTMGCTSTASSLLASNTPVAMAIEEVRPPAVSEGFYPSDTEARRKLVDGFKTNLPSDLVKVKALGIMTPHAGLRYSGQIAMDVWGRVELPPTVLMIGPKHTGIGVDWAVSPATAWTLPGGEVFPVDIDLAKRIANEVEGMELDMGAHAREHGVEIQLPILESLTTPENRPKIVAVAMRHASLDEIMRSAEQLANVIRDMNPRPLLVISSDMNHYEPDAETRRRDALALEALLSRDPQKLLDTCRMNSISMCGLVPAAIVLQTLINLGEHFEIEKISYDTSASRGGDPNRVVGYAGVLIKSVD